MALISGLFPFLFLTTLLLSLQVNARDSQFFSKVTPVNNNNNNLKETEVPNNEAPLNKPEQQPTFIPETENSYGLYGHETGLHPPTTTTTNAAPYTTTTTYKPYKTTTAEEDIANTKYSSNNNYISSKDAYNTNQNEFRTRFTGTTYNNNKAAFGQQNELSDTKYTEEQYKSVEDQNNNNNNYFYNNNDAFGKQNELSDTKFTEGEYNSVENQNNNNENKYFYNNNNAANEKYYYNNNNAANEKYYYNNNNNDDEANNNRYYKPKAVNNNYNGERQGLSDTRFIEGGKYFYDVNTGKYNHPTLNGDSSRGVNSQNWYNNKGYFGNNNVNSIEGNQNQEEFEEDQEDFEP